MTEEEVMLQQKEDEAIAVITAYNNVPYFIIEDDLNEMGQQDYITETKEIVELYKKYQLGQDFITEGSNGDYVPSQVNFKKAASIINKEARFMFANPPTFNVNVDDVDGSLKDDNSIIQDYLDKVLEKNNFKGQIIKAIKDCLIAKRIAIVLNFNAETESISMVFLNSLEFIYKTAVDNPNEMEKFVCFYNMSNTNNKAEQKWFKKTYEKIDDKVYVSESYYDGLGNIIEDMPSIENSLTKLQSIPAAVVLNDGLIGDTKGESDLAKLLDSEGVYSKLANADIDVERKGMNPINYAIDASEGSTKNLSTAPGAFWDIQTDYEGPTDNAPQAKLGLLEPSMNYSAALKTTLDRIENQMYSEVDVPNINSEKLMGVITSGKTISALYWGLVVRCDEKMLTWGPALTYIASMIITGGRLYPECIRKYTNESLPEIENEILVENNYPLPEDVQEEKQQDITEVDASLMSRKAYMKKWRGLSDKDAEDELAQIKLEKDLFENSFVPSYDNPDDATWSQEEDKDEANKNTNEEEKDLSEDELKNQKDKKKK